MKRCPRCGETLPYSEFHKASRAKDGCQPYCKPCRNEYYRKYNRENIDKAVRAQYKYRYGITKEKKRDLLHAQGWACPICGRLWVDDPRDFHLDHDAKTGLVRGVLCPECNKGLGQFYDNPEFLRNAANYLERNAMPTPNYWFLDFDNLVKLARFMADNDFSADEIAKMLVEPWNFSAVYDDAVTDLSNA